MPVRPPHPARRSPAWLMLLVVALLIRGLAPEGWMPVATATGGIGITLCDGMGPADAMMMTPTGMHHKMPAKAPASDHPCAFAGVALADTSPPLAVVAAPIRPTAAAPAVVATDALPGRGLAAPPPPSTGPPTLA